MSNGGQTTALGVGSNSQAGGGKGGAGQFAAPSVTPGTSATSAYANPLQQSQSVYDQAAGNSQAATNNTSNAAGMLGDMAASQNPNYASYAGDTAQQMGQYYNPYTSGVIDSSMNDIARQTAIQQNANGANAQMAGAFGGARHGLVEAATNSEAQRNMGDLSASLYNNMFNTAAGLGQNDVTRMGQNNQFNASQADVAGNRQLSAAQSYLNAGAQQGSLAGQQLSMGNAINNQQMDQGEFARQLQQQVMTGANNQFDATTSQPNNLLNTLVSAMGGSPLNNQTKTTGTTTPGLFDYLSLGAQTMGGKGGA